MRVGNLLAVAAATATFSACGSRGENSSSSPDASGFGSDSGSDSAEDSGIGDGSGGLPPGALLDGGILVLLDASVDAPTAATSSTFTVTVRDFKFYNANDPTTNPDFENLLGDDHANVTGGANVVGTIVSETLGIDGKPIYKNAIGTTRTTHGRAAFDQWYRDVPGANLAQQVPLTLTPSAQGTYAYDSLQSGVPLNPPRDPRKMWFPIDDGTPHATAFGNQSQLHNYSFTTELHTVFVYVGGETFTFSGDDDVFVFINGKLVIDLGGVHVREQATVLLDSLGLTKGARYPLDLFGAERHTIESNLSFTTTVQLRPVAQ